MCVQEVQKLEPMHHGDGLQAPLGSVAHGSGCLGVEACQDVGVVLTGKCDHDVLSTHVSFFEHVSINNVAPEHKGSWQLRSEFFGPPLVEFDYRNVDSAVDESLGQHLCGTASAKQKGAGWHVAGNSQPVGDVFYGPTLADDSKKVALGKDSVGPGDEGRLLDGVVAGLLSPGNGADDEAPVRFQFAAQGAEGDTDQRCVCGKSRTNGHHLTVRHLGHIECARVLHQPQNLLSDLFVGIDHEMVR